MQGFGLTGCPYYLVLTIFFGEETKTFPCKRFKILSWLLCYKSVVIILVVCLQIVFLIKHIFKLE